ncbi:MAG: hypothetical protein AAFO04_13585 [Cyanobacteria bacterium J06592_8]
MNTISVKNFEQANLNKKQFDSTEVLAFLIVATFVVIVFIFFIFLQVLSIFLNGMAFILNPIKNFLDIN